MIRLENAHMRISIKLVGAELCSLYTPQNNTEHMWQAGPLWPKHSPILFPIVGTLKDKSYLHEDRPYTMDKHGFARDKQFDIVEQSKQSVKLRLVPDEQTRAMYPFEFVLHVIYTLVGNTLQIQYNVLNTGTQHLYFSIGGHPAFAVPSGSTNYSLAFDQALEADLLALDGPFINNQITHVAMDHALTINKEILYGNTCIYKNLRAKQVKLLFPNNASGMRVVFDGCDYLAIWSPDPEQFICIEPWWGLPDSVDTDGQLMHKEGIYCLGAQQHFECGYSIVVE